MSRENFVQIAKVAEQTERYDDMAEAMKQVADMKVPLSTEERNLLSVAYKNVIGSRRASWRVMGSLIEREDKKEDTTRSDVMKTYKAKIEKELTEISNQVLSILVGLLDGLGDSKEEQEAKVFYLKMKGDYHRYMAEIYTEGDKKGVVDQSLEAYKKAQELAEKDFQATHPIRLGLALNFSVFYYEILNDQSEACALAKKAFDEAIQELDTLGEDSYKDSTLIMQLLRDNLTLWTANVPENDDQAEDQ